MNYDLFVIGGGINGTGIARDAAGRGYSVALAEMGDFASATSSQSTKLFHGGLRYLEFFEFGLVRKALIEREVLLRAMPHISWPMRFVLPMHSDMRFDSSTPTSRLLSTVMPWMRGRRPIWLIRLGLFMYDHLGGRKILPPTSTLDLTTAPEGEPLNTKFQKAYEYSDCWVEDARLVLLNARDAQDRGANMMPRTKVVSATFDDGLWTITTEKDGFPAIHHAKMLVNAGGPWVENIIRQTVRINSTEGVRLVRGSHIVTKKLYEHNKCYFFQGTDGRIIFAIPYEQEFTLIGTTDQEHGEPSEPPKCTEEEATYLRAFASQYFKKPITKDDIVWTYSGVRPLYDDGAKSATAATRDYVLSVDTSTGGPVLNVFGGKITTYRKLAEHALEHINTNLARETHPWTAGVALPGGDFPVQDAGKLRNDFRSSLPFLAPKTVDRLFRQYGTQIAEIFEGATSLDDCGTHLGHGVTTREVDWAIENEWVTTAEDFLWRRSKLGLHFTPPQAHALEKYIAERHAERAKGSTQ